MEHPDEMQVWLELYCSNPPRDWAKRGVRLYPLGHEVVIQRYLRSGVSIGSAWVDLFWCDWDTAQAVIIGEVVNMLRKPVDRESVDGAARGLVPGDLEKRWPTVWEYLTASTYEDGSKRLTGSLTVFCQDGVLKGLLKDADTEMVLWMSARNLEELLTAFEAAVSSDRAEWRRDKNAGRKRPGKPGKAG